MLFVFMGIVALPLDQATAIGFSAPLIATLLSAVFLKEKVGRHRWLATMIGFLGVLIIIHPDPGTMISQGAIYALVGVRSEEHTSELQSLMRLSDAVFCLNK